MRIECGEKVELGSIMELSVSGQVLRWARHSKLSGGAWNLKSFGPFTVAKRMREETEPTLPVVTIREGEERDINSAAKQKMAEIEDQVRERGVAVLVWNKESVIWKDTSATALIRRAQLKYIDVGELRLVTRKRRPAEQIEGDKVQNIATGSVKIEGSQK